MRSAILAFCAFSFSALEAEQQDALQMLREGKFAQARNHALQLLGSVPENMAAIDLAMLHHVVGSAANQLGQYAQAEAHLTSGMEALRGAEPAAPELAVSLLTSLAESHLHLAEGHSKSAPVAGSIPNRREVSPGEPSMARPDLGWTGRSAIGPWRARQSREVLAQSLRNL